MKFLIGTLFTPHYNFFLDPNIRFWILLSNTLCFHIIFIWEIHLGYNSGINWEECRDLRFCSITSLNTSPREKFNIHTLPGIEPLNAACKVETLSLSWIGGHRKEMHLYIIVYFLQWYVRTTYQSAFYQGKILNILLI